MGISFLIPPFSRARLKAILPKIMKLATTIDQTAIKMMIDLWVGEHHVALDHDVHLEK